MSLLQLVFKQMRQRALATWLTLFSVTLGVALTISVLILQREASDLFAVKDYGFEVLIGPPKGSPLQLVLNTVYQLDVSPGNIPYQLYEDMSRKGPPPPGRPYYEPLVRIAIPIMVGDSYKGHRIIGTSPQMFGSDDEGKPALYQYVDAHGKTVMTPFQCRLDKWYEFAQGRDFAPRKFEAVLGSEVARKEHFNLYDFNLSLEENEKRGAVFQATHGVILHGGQQDIHKPKWRVVGVLKPTHTAYDSVLFIPYISLYAIEEHEIGLLEQKLRRDNYDPTAHTAQENQDWLAKEAIDPARLPMSMKRRFRLAGPVKPATSGPAAQEPVDELIHEAAAPAPKKEAAPAVGDEDEKAYTTIPPDDDFGDIVPDLPPSEWELSAIMIKARSSITAETLAYNFKVINNEATAVYPAFVMREFFDTFLNSVTWVLLIIAFLVTIVAGVGILVSIYNSISARSREIAILRALGATRRRVLTLICTEAGLIGLAGGILGFVVGHLCGIVESNILDYLEGKTISWWRVSPWEPVYLAGVVVLAVIAGLVPALKAYRTPVATHLVSS